MLDEKRLKRAVNHARKMSTSSLDLAFNRVDAVRFLLTNARVRKKIAVKLLAQTIH